MSYVLYGHRRSGSLIVELALAELGIDYITKDIDLNANAQRDAAYASVNPQRKLPALITPEGETLTETVAILLTLDERHRQVGLLPPPASTDRAQALRIILFVATELYPLVEINDYPERFAPSPGSAATVREIARDLWRQRWLLIEDQVTADPHALTWGFSAVDMYIAVVSRWAQQDSWRAKNLPKIENMTRALSQRAPSNQVWRRHRPDDLPERFE